MLEKKNKSLLDKITLKLSGFVHIMKVSGDEDSKQTVDIIARSISYIESGSVALAISEVVKLPESSQQAFSIWIKNANNYVNSIDASESILRYVTRPSVNNIDQSKS